MDTLPSLQLFCEFKIIPRLKVWKIIAGELDMSWELRYYERLPRACGVRLGGGVWEMESGKTFLNERMVVGWDCKYTMVVVEIKIINQYSIKFLVRTRYWLGDLIYNISCNPHNSPKKLLFLPLFYVYGNSDWEKWSNFACAAHLGKVPGIWIQVCLTPKLLL